VTDTPPPLPGPTTAAMNLRPAAGARRSATAAEVRARVEDVLTLHRPLELTDRSMCRECLASHPCRTVLTLQGVAPTPAPPEEGSQ